jgi:hypothetical protein
MRFVLAFLVVMAGCVATLPGDNGLTADLAAETARMVVQMRQEIASARTATGSVTWATAASRSPAPHAAARAASRKAWS